MACLIYVPFDLLRNLSVLIGFSVSLSCGYYYYAMTMEHVLGSFSEDYSPLHRD